MLMISPSGNFKQMLSRAQSYRRNFQSNLLNAKILVFLLAENGHVTFFSQ